MVAPPKHPWKRAACTTTDGGPAAPWQRPRGAGRTLRSLEPVRGRRWPSTAPKAGPRSTRTAAAPPRTRVVIAEVALVQLVKTAGQLGLSPVAERGLGSFQPPNDDDPFA